MAARTIQDPPFARFLFDNTSSSWIWLLARLYLGWQWLQAGWHKVTDPAWMNGGTALKGFWTRAVAVPEPPAKPAITYGWYREFLTALLEGGHYTWFGKLIAVGEVLVGVALILGLLTGFAAFAGAFMNFNFMLAGTASTNPVLFTLAILLLMAWKVAGYWGVDRWLLPALGTPWDRRPAAPERFEPEPVSPADERPRV
ncbi:DoxX family protein [Symbiobacterium thermophilum]|uniref:DoxX family protein n=1 Tax=Symbiobacterium thermophilum TaxID=2734 RepID=UPI0035C6B87F